VFTAALRSPALLAFKLGDFQQSYDFVSRALERYPVPPPPGHRCMNLRIRRLTAAVQDHNESQELTKQLKQHFALL
jgi:hypothetical protein